ncbi:hypothetical protein BpHYR1_013091 [Brachionus plicatilis]|uniref:Uncharacterized protein n=1 Tax=Brachionus plicatilis TaxID=10195 RepID=A0A3M7S4X8_BRAPC|nr:hypothetical protein BpHYR1_013091 [Brachionus plicatilis]
MTKIDDNIVILNKKISQLEEYLPKIYEELKKLNEKKSKVGRLNNYDRPLRKTSSNSKTQEQAEIYDEEINKLFGAEHNDSSMQTLREKNAAKVAVLKIRFETESLRLGIDDWREYWNSILQKRRKKRWRGKQ